MPEFLPDDSSFKSKESIPKRVWGRTSAKRRVVLSTARVKWMTSSTADPPRTAHGVPDAELRGRFGRDSCSAMAAECSVACWMAQSGDGKHIKLHTHPCNAVGALVLRFRRTGGQIYLVGELVNEML